MKKLFAIALTMLAFTSFAQEHKTLASPPASTSAKIGNASLTITYHQPAVKGRNVWAGDLAPYGKVWRTGANDATNLTVSEDVTIEGKKLAKGTYALFTIPGEKEWVIIINKTAKQWGAYDYKEADDVLRVKVPSKSHAMTERFTIKAEDSGKVALLWDKVEVDFNVK
ncbi:Protein of unknown function [Pseudarcicella hirudinis]|uniref:DUF2911 domain-containing protein n=1 Tax=Pseudarcicella hirudinis TaxID=1079859 RepID=A0A1I5YJB6_9BACT|nr:DUF2911 domain-containing protein [Pseudarcicella hirudinis]SFQ44306.1 Protein of unknown function [Pseudarcicella hirudinis]